MSIRMGCLMHCEICQGLHCVQHFCHTVTIRNLKQNKIKVRILFRVPLFSNHLETMKIKVSKDNLVLKITRSWISFLPTGLGANPGNKLLCKMTVCFGMSTIPTIRQFNINILQIHPYALITPHFSLQNCQTLHFYQPSTNNAPQPNRPLPISLKGQVKVSIRSSWGHLAPKGTYQLLLRPRSTNLQA